MKKSMALIYAFFVAIQMIGFLVLIVGMNIVGSGEWIFISVYAVQLLISLGFVVEGRGKLKAVNTQ